MTPNHRQLEVFNAVMTAGGASRAAVLLRTSQPTVSREIRELERLLGLTLFSRTGSRLTPTAQAHSLHAIVKRSFIGLDEIFRAAAALRDGDLQHLRIACLPAFGQALVPHVASILLRSWPDLRLTVHSLEEAALHADLSGQMFDVGLTETAHDVHGTSSQEVAIGELLCILPLAHPLARLAVIAPRDLEGVDFVYYGEGDTYRRRIDTAFAEAGVSRLWRVETTTATSLIAMVEMGVGVSIVNPLTALAFPDRPVAVRRFALSIPYVINVWRSPKPGSSSLCAAFCAALDEVFTLNRIAADRLPDRDRARQGETV